jgi:hypothetical protein
MCQWLYQRPCVCCERICVVGICTDIVCICMCICICICICICMYICMYVLLNTWHGSTERVWLHRYYLGMCIFNHTTFIYMYIYIHTHTRTHISIMQLLTLNRACYTNFLHICMFATHDIHTHTHISLLRFRTLNRARLGILITNWLESSSIKGDANRVILSPEAVAKQEPVLWVGRLAFLNAASNVYFTHMYVRSSDIVYWSRCKAGLVG